MQIILLIAGLILLLAGGSWFAGATTVGIVLLAVFAVVTIIQLLMFGAVARHLR